MNVIHWALALVFLVVVAIAAVYFFAPTVFARLRDAVKSRASAAVRELDNYGEDLINGGVPPRTPDSREPAGGTSAPVKPDVRSTNGLDFDAIPKGWTIQDVIMRVGRYFTPEEKAYLRHVGVQWEEEARPQPGVDRTGGELGLGGGMVRVNALTAGQFYPYHFEVLPGTVHVDIDVFGAPNFAYNETAFTLRDAAGNVVDSMPMTQHAGTLGTTYTWATKYALNGARPSLAAGHYTIEIATNGAGSLGVQYQQWNAVGSITG